MKTSRKKSIVISGRHKRTAKITTYSVQDNIQHIDISLIDFNPNNHRKLYSHQAIKDFAKVLKIHGIIHALTVRPKNDRFELVSGERRLRAALAAKFETVPAVVKNYSDAEVSEIQLSENIHREDPHPLHIAEAIYALKNGGMTMKQIASRLGKSMKFVHIRLKLLNLIDEFREMFLAGTLTIDQSADIASLSPDAQREFYNEECSDWKEDDNFQLPDLSYTLNRYKYDLDKAPFDITDKKLVAAVGSCTQCPFNSACQNSLFPDLAASRFCTSSSCYKNKCMAHQRRQLEDAVYIHQPSAFIRDDYHSSVIDTLVSEFPSIHQYDPKDVTICRAPEQPDRKQYMELDRYDDDSFLDAVVDDISEDDDGGEIDPDESPLFTRMFDENGFSDAVAEFIEAKDEFDRQLQAGDVLKGIKVSERSITPCFYRIGKVASAGKEVNVTAKEVQQAIKDKTVTIEMLEAEKMRLDEREDRAKELDVEKIYSEVYTSFCSLISEQKTALIVTNTDDVIIRFIIYQSLNLDAKEMINQLLINEADRKLLYSGKVLFEKLEAMLPEQLAYMVRLAITGRTESKYPNNYFSHFTHRAAESCGIDINRIKKQYGEKVDEREDRLEMRKRDLTKHQERIARRNSL